MATMQTNGTARTFDAIDYRDPYLMVARDIASAPQDAHLRLLVRLLTQIQRYGVDLSLHMDCIIEALCLELDDD